jgi:hypothetical protein
MFARVTMTQAALDRADEAVRVNKERVIPGAEGIAGFKGGLWLLDRAAGKRLAITRVLRSALAAAQRSGWRATTPPHRDIDREADDMAMYAGSGVGDVIMADPAATVVEDLVSDLA